MMTDDAFIGQLEEYLDRFDGETPLPDSVRAEVHAVLPRIRQVSARPSASWAASLAGISATTRWGLAAAGLVVVIAMGTVLVAANRDHGVAATQAPSTTPAIPSFPSTATYLRGAPVGPCVIVRAGFNCTAPGTYRLDPDVATVAAAIDVPRGWFEWDLGSGTAGVLVDSGSNAPNGSGWGILFSSFGRVRADPCDPAAGFVEPPVGHPAVDTAAEVVQAMQQWPGFQVSTPRPITIGGYNGLLVEVTSSRTVISCPTAEVWEAASGIAVEGYPIAAQPTLRPAQFRILEIAGRLLIIRTTDFPQESPFEDSQGVAANPTRHAADQPALQAILNSLRFAPNP